MRLLGIGSNAEEDDTLFSFLDADGDGRISYEVGAKGGGAKTEGLCFDC